MRCELLARRFRSGGRDCVDACGHPCFRVHSTCFFDVWICLSFVCDEDLLASTKFFQQSFL